MKLATIYSKGRDGELVLVSRDFTYCAHVSEYADTLQEALDNWGDVVDDLTKIYQKLNQGELPSDNIFPLDFMELAAPLPRAYQWADASAYLTHVELVRKARGAEMPENFKHDPLMYQGGSDNFLSWCAPIQVESEEWGIDFESEVAIITDDVPMGISAQEAGEHIKLIMLVNDVSLRNLIPNELSKNFGFFQSKPATSFSPFAITPDELGDAWDGQRLHLPLFTYLNDKEFGRPNAGIDMHFSFPELIAHAAKTRLLGAGTIIGSGTVSNSDRSKGSSCIAERRMLEKIETGTAKTPFMKFGDRVRIEMLDEDGKSIFGAIDQEVVRYGTQPASSKQEAHVEAL